MTIISIVCTLLVVIGGFLSFGILFCVNKLKHDLNDLESHVDDCFALCRISYDHSSDNAYHIKYLADFSGIDLPVVNEGVINDSSD